MESENNIFDFLKEKLNNLKNLIIDLSNDKEKIKDNFFELEDKKMLVLKLFFLNEENKQKYIFELMEKTYINNTTENYNKIIVYFDMLLELKSEILKDCLQNKK